MNAHESGPPDDAASPGRGAEHDSPGRGLQPEAGPGDEIAGPGADHVDGVRSGNGAALGSDPASEPDPVPGWITDLVPVADDARAILLADRVVLAAGVPLALVLGWAGARRDVGHLPIWAGALMAAAAAAVVLRPGRAAAAPDLRAQRRRADRARHRPDCDRPGSAGRARCGGSRARGADGGHGGGRRQSRRCPVAPGTAPAGPVAHCARSRHRGRGRRRRTGGAGVAGGPELVGAGGAGGGRRRRLPACAAGGHGPRPQAPGARLRAPGRLLGSAGARAGVVRGLHRPARASPAALRPQALSGPASGHRTVGS